MSGTSEEKSLPPSEKKIRDARGKGQVAKSQDLVNGALLFAAITWFVYVLSEQQLRVEAILNLVARRAWTEPFDTLWPQIRALTQQTLLELAIPLFLVCFAAVLFTNLIVMKGFIFSVTPIVPKFENINPVSGAQKIFSIRNVVEFVKSITKLCALGTAFVLVFRAGLQPLLVSSSCGASCVRQSFEDLLVPLIVTAIITFFVVGIADVMIQNWLFQRDMKMTKSELKRERKDSEGDPMIMQQRRKHRREMQTYSSKMGLHNASLLIASQSGGWAVAVRYVRGETPVPLVVARAAPEQAAAMISEAIRAQIPVVQSPDLADVIGRSTRRGDPVPQAQFQRVADLLVAAKLI